MQIEEYNKLKRDVEDRKREYDREVGAYENTMAQLKSEFGCKTLKDAKKLLAKKRAKLKASKKEFERDLKRFVKKHRHALKGD